MKIHEKKNNAPPYKKAEFFVLKSHCCSASCALHKRARCMHKVLGDGIPTRSWELWATLTWVITKLLDSSQSSYVLSLFWNRAESTDFSNFVGYCDPKAPSARENLYAPIQRYLPRILKQPGSSWWQVVNIKSSGTQKRQINALIQKRLNSCCFQSFVGLDFLDQKNITRRLSIVLDKGVKMSYCAFFFVLAFSETELAKINQF